MTGPALRLVDVSRSYGAVAAVADVSLDIAAGSFVALVGASGSGKSTLLKTINRLVPLDAGYVEIAGRRSDDCPVQELRRDIGYVFQNVGLFPHMTVADNVGIGLRLRGVRDRTARVTEMLALVGLDPALATRMPDALSGGQRQRVGVARALAPAAGLLLMDEPFGALDPVTRDTLGRETRVLHDRLALTTIMVTHDMAEALLLADRVVVMAGGRIVGDATPAGIAGGGRRGRGAGAGGGAARSGGAAAAVGSASMNAIIAALATLGHPLAAHVVLAASALALGLAIALPLVLVARAVLAVGRVALAAASLIQTIPALALLALFYPLLLWLSGLVGGGIPALGFLPSLLALALYAVLPILRNGVTGLASLDPALGEAADGLGMTPRQKLWWVEVPLVAPIVMAGVRTATMWTIGAATLSTTVGQPSLGDPIFAGLQIQDWTLVLAGCIAAAALALVADGVLALVEWGVGTRRRLPVIAGAAVLALGIGAATATLASGGGDGARPTITIGAKNFSEQYILARLIGDRLTGAGYAVRYRQGLGSAVIYRALAAGDIDVYVEYAGTLWTNQMRRHDVPPRAAMIAAIGRWAGATSGVRVIGPLGFENAYVFAMRGDVARAHGIATIADLAAQAPQLRLGSDLEFLHRPEWQAVRGAYSLRFAASRSYSPTFMYRALASGDVDVITAFSSDGRIAADRLVVLTDPKGAIPSYDALLLAAPARAREARFVGALTPLIGAIPVTRMQAANYLVDRDTDKQSPQTAARLLARGGR